jgi:hypothetical protein
MEDPKHQYYLKSPTYIRSMNLSNQHGIKEKRVESMSCLPIKRIIGFRLV